MNCVTRLKNEQSMCNILIFPLAHAFYFSHPVLSISRILSFFFTYNLANLVFFSASSFYVLDLSVFLFLLLILFCVPLIFSRSPRAREISHKSFIFSLFLFYPFYSFSSILFSSFNFNLLLLLILYNGL